MTDPYLLLTPLLALAVLALARFVGCDWFFGLERVPPEPEEVPFIDSFVLGTPRTDPSKPFTGFAGMVIKVGSKPLTVTQLGRVMPTASTAIHVVKLVLRTSANGGDDLRTVTIPPGTTAGPDDEGFAYGYWSSPR